MRSRIRKWGNSLGIRIPKIFAVQLGILEGEEVEILIKKNSIVLSPTDTSLEHMLEKVTNENLHNETDTGSSIGREIW